VLYDGEVCLGGGIITASDVPDTPDWPLPVLPAKRASARRKSTPKPKA
jgi:hypothetical protein